MKDLIYISKLFANACHIESMSDLFFNFSLNLKGIQDIGRMTDILNRSHQKCFYLKELLRKFVLELYQEPLIHAGA